MSGQLPCSQAAGRVLWDQRRASWLVRTGHPTSLSLVSSSKEGMDYRSCSSFVSATSASVLARRGGSTIRGSLITQTVAPSEPSFSLGVGDLPPSSLQVINNWPLSAAQAFLVPQGSRVPGVRGRDPRRSSKNSILSMTFTSQVRPDFAVLNKY